MALIDKVSSSGTKFIDDLLTPTKWAGAAVSYSFSTSASSYGSSYGFGEAGQGFATLNIRQQTAARDALSAWSDVANIKFSEASGSDAQIRIAASDMPKTSWAYVPSEAEQGGDVWLGKASFNASPVQGNYAYLTIMHEIGHALGLGHPHDAKLAASQSAAGVGEGVDNGLCPCCAGALHGQSVEANIEASSPFMAHAEDSISYSVMSYRSFEGADMSKGYSNEVFGYAQSPMARDIAAIQHLYGANYDAQSTDTVYKWSETTGEKFINGAGQGAPGANKIFETVWDGGGNDTLDFSNFKSNLKVDLNPGGWVDLGTSQLANLGNGHTAPGHIGLAYLFESDARAYIENVVGGSGNDSITGNLAGNLLMGGAGADTVQGLGGQNILVGGYLGSELGLVGIQRSEVISFDLPKLVSDGNDMLIGGDHNNIFVPGQGSNKVVGGVGLDTIIIDMPTQEIHISSGSSGALTITYGSSQIEATGIEFLATQDGIVSFSGAATVLEDLTFVDEISLLYRAGLGREIEATGLDYWAGVTDSEDDLAFMSNSIINSAEFAERFQDPAQMSDEDFVEQLYTNVLGRDAGSDEVFYWDGRLDAGMTRSDVLLAFAQSEENRDQLNWGVADETGGEVSGIEISQALWAQIWG